MAGPCVPGHSTRVHPGPSRSLSRGHAGCCVNVTSPHFANLPHPPKERLDPQHVRGAGGCRLDLGSPNGRETASCIGLITQAILEAMSLGPDKQIMSFVITQELREQLRAVKERDGVPESEQIRRALTAWFEKREPARARTTAKGKSEGRGR